MRERWTCDFAPAYARPTQLVRDSASRLLEKEVVDIEHMIRKLQLEMARQTAEILRLEQVVWRRGGLRKGWIGMMALMLVVRRTGMRSGRDADCGLCHWHWRALQGLASDISRVEIIWRLASENLKKTGALPAHVPLASLVE